MINKRVRELMMLFPGSFINGEEELILDKKSNLYFSVKRVETEQDLYRKVLSWCSRDACKTEPFRSKANNLEYQNRVRNSLNEFLNVSYDCNEWMLIYTYLGNGVNDALCDKFIQSGFDMRVIKDHDEEERGRRGFL